MVPNANFTPKRPRTASQKPIRRWSPLSLVVQLLIILSVLALVYLVYSAYQTFNNQFDYLKQPESLLSSY
ncbi:MAG: hypothetical protein EOO39_21245 [Cytophagaceae bacterium]|nr:MAG: hypothetical protein EOO39_21245 [Cytophagaceae bacterium]